MEADSELPAGAPRDVDRLLPLLYEELRALAHAQLAGAGPAPTLQTTALVHEAWLRMVERRAQVCDRDHFRALAAHVIRNLLVDHARMRGAVKRGGGRGRVTIADGHAISERDEVDVVAVHEALERLAAFGPRQASVVELRFFGGLSVEEAAGVLGVSKRLVEKDWTAARAWLRRELGGEVEA